MIPVPTGVRVWLATGHTDMRRGFPSLSLQVQEVLRRDPLSGHLFCFRGRRGDLLKVIWHSERLSLTVNVRSRPGRLPFYEASGARQILVAEPGGRRDLDFARAAWLSALRDGAIRKKPGDRLRLADGLPLKTLANHDSLVG
ncbi:IS66 family insertion sequence element accessory protein TnpB [Rhodomicrobium vannielii]|uniref:IS66 family insertion sequence element accessory protein TnpB n=1 Tax=Rhodomicrobium vannielii TaxID=1069 RepID=UPI003CCF0585